MACPFCGGPIASEEQNECGDYETTAYARIAALESELTALKAKAPVIPVKWTKNGWTNAAPVVLECETDGYIDWPLALIIASAEEGSES